MHFTHQVTFHPFKIGDLEQLLDLTLPPFAKEEEALHQLRYLLRYVEVNGCKSFALESHYIDRDHIEDHSVFYSKSLFPHVNWCRRLHFFAQSESETEASLRSLVKAGVNEGLDRQAELSAEFSSEFYLGFAVIRPLAGSPVGRTVVSIPRGQPKNHDLERSFDCTRKYRVHLCGSELLVQGLAFQQQDLGVSACATTAIWASLQKARDLEEIGSVTPAQITALASRYALPFGRAMPSEGLSIDQMCQAIQAVGVSPNIYRTDNFQVARAYLYMACKSGIAPILILKREEDGGWHAVTVAGMKVTRVHNPQPLAGTVDDTAEFACDLSGIYIHDDRFGPYLRANLVDSGGPSPKLEIEIDGKGSQSWSLRQIIAPVHGKVRLSFADLVRIAESLAFATHGWREAYYEKQPSNPKVLFGNWILRGSAYVNQLIRMKLSTDTVWKLCNTLRLPRYVGVVHLEGDYFDPIDVLIDTTETIRNTRCLALIPLANTKKDTMSLAVSLAGMFKCRVIQ